MKYSRSSSSSARHRLLLPLLGFAMILTACPGRTDVSNPAASDGVSRRPPDPPAGSFHPAFSFSQATFEELVETLPEEARSLVAMSPSVFLDQLVDLSAEPEELTRLVDKSHHLPIDYEPADLVDLDDYSDRLDLNRPGHQLRAVLLPDLFAMVDAARAEGLTLLISSAYRSYQYQEGIYQYWVDTLGQEEADRTSARPGTSQHQLGTAIDFGCICEDFADTAAGRWLASYAWKYGFSLSYPDGLESLTGYAFESWHFRYIGKVAARVEKEFFAGLQQHLTEFADTNFGVFLVFLIEF